MTTSSGEASDAGMRPGHLFTCDGVEWIAWTSGSSAYGTGTCGPAALDAIHFARSENPGVPLFEALLPTGRFYALFDDELVVLLRGASKIVDPAERPVKAVTRRGAGLL